MIIFVSVMLMVISLFAYETFTVKHQIDTLNQSWLSYKSQNIEKTRKFRALSANLGYGAFIHDFKNYVIRKDDMQLEKLRYSIGAVQVILEQYSALITTPEERLAIKSIKEVMDKYKKNIHLATDLVKKGKSSKEIDKTVQVNDVHALRGLEELRQVIISEHPYYRDKTHKPVLATEIRMEMGYGGMIHHFKNYVLRGDDEYYKKTSDSINNVNSLIIPYLKSPTSSAEKSGLRNLYEVIHEYKAKLERTKILIRRGLLPEAIDKQIRVDDTHALAGLTVLDQDIILQIEKKSEAFGERIFSINESKERHAYIQGFILFFLAVFLYFVFTRYFINPVKELSVVMSELAHGNTEKQFSYPINTKTELSSVAKALKVFQKNETKRRIAEDEVRRLAMTDPLTGLANRNQFEKRFPEMASLARRDKRLIALFALDLDKFKPINDTYGHAAGDTVLKNVADNLSQIFRETDLITRIGGDEFLVTLYGPENLETVKTVAKRVLRLLSAPIMIGEDVVNISASIGIAIHEPHNTETVDVLIRRADKSLYVAKESGRNMYHIDSESDVGKPARLVYKRSEKE